MKNKELTICWSITSVCNRPCWYCFSRYENKVTQHMSQHLIDVTLDKLEKQSKFQNIRLIILGGEPTLYPEILNICNRCLQFCRKVVLVTNGDNIDTIIKLPTDISIDISYHGQDLLSFKNIIKIISNYHYLQVLCVLDTQCIDNCIELSNWCLENNIFFEPIPIVDNISECALIYPENILNKFNSNIFYNIPEIGVIDSLSVYKHNLLYTSYIDHMKICEQTNIAIYPNGFVYPCCKNGLLHYKKHIEENDIFKYRLFCTTQYCMKNRGCIDFSGWRQDPDGFFPWNNE